MYDHVQPLLRNLHRLPVRSRSDYKISTLCFNTFTNSSPVYIAQFLSHLSTPLPDTSIHPPQTHPSIFLLSKLSHLVKELSSSHAQLNGIFCLVDSDTLSFLLRLKPLSKLISSDLFANLLYLLDAVCVCVCVCVCVRVHVRSDPIITVFVPGVEYTYNVM